MHHCDPGRRALLRSIAIATAAGALPRFAFAEAGSDKRFVLVILRGAADGLALCPPYGDGAYRKLRGELALKAPGSSDGVLKLDALFGLHPAFENLHGAYTRGEAAVVHAVASPYRERSHFDGQDVVETGTGTAGAVRDGWLNRALMPLGGTLGSERAIAMGQMTPLVLRGSESVTSWAPSRLRGASEDTLARLQRLYKDDPFFADRLDQALRSQDIATDMALGQQRPRRGREALADDMAHAARFLTADGGPQIAVVESGGWDTHANQGAHQGQLANRFRQLDQAIEKLRTGLGGAWSETVVAIVTEFGRTARVNGTRGTDHGTAAAAVLVGGAVHGGRVIADWPGLTDRYLYENRDLAPTADLRSVFKSVLVEHLALDAAFVDRIVFPDSAGVRPIEGLIA